jgi:damage-control phosphatase, subfamily I
MKLTPTCYECIRRLIVQAAELATNDLSLRQRAIGEAIKILDSEFSYSQISIVIAGKIHNIIREVTGNPDPYRAMKESEMMLARKSYSQLRQRNNNDLRGCLQLAAAANAIDFFTEASSIRQHISEPVDFSVDDSEHLEAKLKRAAKVLYLADNAGEIYFDLPLVKHMRRFAQVIYAVKPSPVQNDLTLDDVKRSGLEAEFERVMSTGVDSPGIILSWASAQFRQEFESADLVFAKGMGNYEALSEYPSEGRVFYCLKAKCQPVADSLGVPINSYVARLQ